MDWLKEARLQSDMTMKDIAEKVGISQVSYWQIEHGKCRPKVENAKKIGQLLGIDWRLFYDDQQKAG